MPTSVKWGPKSCEISTSRIIPFSGLKITQAAKTETQTNTSGGSVVNVKGRDAMSVALTVKYLAAAGVDPHAQMEEWLALVGKAYPLYIGGKRIGPAELTLKNVEVANTFHTNSGDILGLDVALTFQEFATEQTVKPAASTKKASGSSGSSSLKKKVEAMKATASKPEKSLRKPRGEKSSRLEMLN